VAVERGLLGAQFFGFVFGWMHGHLNYGRDNIYREFRKRQEAEESAAAREAATALEPQDESARALYRMGRRGGVMGSPEEIRENGRKYEGGHEECLLFFFQLGGRKDEHTMESLELFGTQVMPEFKDRHHLHQRWREQQLDGVQFPVNSSI